MDAEGYHKETNKTPWNTVKQKVEQVVSKLWRPHLPKPHDPYIHSFECVTVHNNSPKTKRDYNESGTIISMYHKLKW